ncbi:MAG: nitrite reductase small subunit NirD [Alphaproteobacteria bacterium]|nr:MAG: nitrite reductase small subunit NirD [Alphaproteobacteria bacterium]
MTEPLALMRVCALADIPVQGARRVLTPVGEIAVFRTLADQVFALKNQCPHKKGPLSEGIVHGNKVTCPLHNWVISLETGEAQGADHGCTGTIPVQVSPDGQVSLALPAKAKVSA